MTPYVRAPHGGAPSSVGHEGFHAALLIDFDNVTMGMRSDLSKELKRLLASDVIKGKVSVQRAYADWRRYPQYIVPLSEASIDLIFAPAYGSNKKNATDIRMAIDALELIFIRPEIGTFILLTGDSDFSSLVLKLKEYGKYVIGVGIQESSSDILVQNCDEYYSYTSLTGLTKTTESGQKPQDPWVLVSDALKRMTDRQDVMRSDRLKQVMQEIDAGFDEGSFGFGKFSKFLTEASSRGLVKLKRLENGQYEVAPPGGGRGRGDGPEGSARQEAPPRRERSRGRRDRSGQEGGRQASGRRAPEEGAKAAEGDPLRRAYDFLASTLHVLRDEGRTEVRDSDVKRKMLDEDGSFDEAELGFSKFSRFLQQAEEHGVIEMRRSDAGNLLVSLPGTDGRAREAEPVEARAEESHEEARLPDREEPLAEPAAEPEEVEASAGDGGYTVVEVGPDPDASAGLRLGPRRGSTRRRGDDDPPPLFEGQVASVPASAAVQGGGSATAVADGAEQGPLDASRLGLPTDPGAIVRYLTHRYKGVGEKTAEALVERFGPDLFEVLRDRPAALEEVVPAKRAEQVLEAWRADYARRSERSSGNGGR